MYASLDRAVRCLYKATAAWASRKRVNRWPANGCTPPPSTSIFQPWAVGSMRMPRPRRVWSTVTPESVSVPLIGGAGETGVFSAVAGKLSRCFLLIGFALDLLEVLERLPVQLGLQ